MQLRVVVTARGPAPGPGTPLRVEVRDGSVADGAATIVAAADEAVAQEGESAELGELVLDVPDDVAPRDCTVWAHVRAAGGEQVTAGDWITVQSYPASPAAGGRPADEDAATVAVEVVQI